MISVLAGIRGTTAATPTKLTTTISVDNSILVLLENLREPEPELAAERFKALLRRTEEVIRHRNLKRWD